MHLYPGCYEMSINLRDGTEVFLRSVQETDSLFFWICLGNYLLPLCACDSFLFYAVCPRNWSTSLLMLITKKSFGLAAFIDVENSGPIIGVIRYAYDSERELPKLAVAIRDDLQGKGLGSILLSRAINVGRENGFSRFEAMIAPQNKTIMHIFKQIAVRCKIFCKQEAYLIEIQA
jgi:acetyltransferase